MSLRVTILTDDVGGGRDVVAEHGLSLLVETREHGVLLDTGQTGVCVENAARLHADLGGLRAVVLSHGHYDHGGGLLALLHRLPGLDVIAHPAVFARKYARPPGREDRDIGLPYGAHDLRRLGATLRLSTAACDLGGGLFTTGPIPRVSDFEEDDPHFQVKVDGECHTDCFVDDQAVVARTPEGLVVFVGCAHAGVVNTVRHAVTMTGDERVRAVIGGFHLVRATPERIDLTVAALQQMKVGQVVACHCTGPAAIARLRATLKERFTAGLAGLRLTF